MHTLVNQNYIDLWEKAEKLIDSKVKLDLLEEAVKLADIQNDIRNGFFMRLDLISAAVFSGYPVKAMSAFRWCISTFEDNPYYFSETELLWEYKWIIDEFIKFSEISLEKEEELFLDMEKRYKRNDLSLRSYYMLRCFSSIHRGDKESATIYYKHFENLPRDYQSDCKACELDNQIRYYLFIEDYDKVFKTASKILSGEFNCGEVPHVTYGQLIIPFYQLDKQKEAKNCYQKGYKLINKNARYVQEFAHYMLYLSLIDDPKCLDLLQKHVISANDNHNHLSKFYFFLSAQVVLKKIAKTGKSEIKLHLPDLFDQCKTRNNHYSFKELITWFEKETNKLAEEFNQKYNNNHYTHLIDKYLLLL